MMYLNKNNKNPAGITYLELEEILAESVRSGRGNVVGVGNNTTAFYLRPLASHRLAPHTRVGYGSGIAVKHFDTIIAVLKRGTVAIYTGGYRTTATIKRLDWVLRPIGYATSKTNKGHGRVRWGESYSSLKIYRVKDGMYLPFEEGMILEPVSG